MKASVNELIEKGILVYVDDNQLFTSDEYKIEFGPKQRPLIDIQLIDGKADIESINWAIDIPVLVKVDLDQQVEWTVYKKIDEI